jgi:hypothetical protein
LSSSPQCGLFFTSLANFVIGMPRNGAITFSDLIGKLDAVRVTCERRGRYGRYRLQSLIAEHGGEASVPD